MADEMPKPEATNTEETSKPDDAPKSDAVAEIRHELQRRHSGEFEARNSPAPDSTSSSIQDYYRYRYEPIDGQYGDNGDSTTEKRQPRHQGICRQVKQRGEHGDRRR